MCLGFERIYQTIKTYPISVVEVRDKDLPSVCRKFQRINQPGKPLNRFDLVSAMTFTKDFDLRERLAGVGDRHSPVRSDQRRGDRDHAAILATRAKGDHVARHRVTGLVQSELRRYQFGVEAAVVATPHDQTGELDEPRFGRICIDRIVRDSVDPTVAPVGFPKVKGEQVGDGRGDLNIRVAARRRIGGRFNGQVDVQRMSNERLCFRECAEFKSRCPLCIDRGTRLEVEHEPEVVHRIAAAFVHLRSNELPVTSQLAEIRFAADPLECISRLIR